LASHRDYAIYCAAAVGSFVTALLYGLITRGLREISIPPDEDNWEDDLDDEPESRASTLAIGVPLAARAELPARPTRGAALIFFLIGAGGLLANEVSADIKGKLCLAILLCCPLLLSIGVGGLIDPRILWSVRAEGRLYPRPVRVVGGVLGLAAIAATAYLALVAYRHKL
jgi:hypothetical protein